jgi:hypothetical protein
MASYHLNPVTGTPGSCRAKAGNCPFSPVEEHHASAAAAREAFESKMELAAAKPTPERQLKKHQAELAALKSGVEQVIQRLDVFSPEGRELQKQWNEVGYMLESHYGKQNTYQARRSYASYLGTEITRMAEAVHNRKPLYLAPRLRELGQAFARESGPTPLY